LLFSAANIQQNVLFLYKHSGVRARCFWARATTLRDDFGNFGVVELSERVFGPPGVDLSLTDFLLL
jgi:hypothetical protein